MADDSKSPGAPPSEPPPPPKKDGEETKEEEQPKDSDAKSSGKDPRVACLYIRINRCCMLYLYPNGQCMGIQSEAGR
eukprot:1392143-Amorphochlora_amoeboformis.AAC.1